MDQESMEIVQENHVYGGSTVGSSMGCWSLEDLKTILTPLAIGLLAILCIGTLDNLHKEYYPNSFIYQRAVEER